MKYFFSLLLLFLAVNPAPVLAQPRLKCGLSHLAEKINTGELTKPLAVTRDNLQKSVVSPSGFFRIHYDTAGINRPSYSIDDLAAAFDSSLSYEAGYLGFPYPPSDGSGEYDIYVKNLNSIYGETVPEFEIQPGSGRYTSYIRIENDFAGFPTTGIAAARVTAAHELHHAIQIGNYIFRSADIFFHELTSTALEDEVFPEVNDYLNYLPEYMNGTSRQFNDNSGYNLAIWNLFLAKKYSYSLILNQWDLFRSFSALTSISESLLRAGSSFKKELGEFGIWTFFTGHRAVPGKYFPDASRFPRLRNLASLSFSPPALSVDLALKPLSNNYLLIVNGSDSLMKIITRENVSAAISSPKSDAAYRCTLYDYEEPGSAKITDGYWQKVSADNLSFFLGQSALNNRMVDSLPGPTKDKLPDVYPSPFVKSKNPNGYIYFSAEEISGNEAGLYIYSAAMDELYRSVIRFNPVAKSVVPFKIIDLNLGSGVYIYYLTSGDFKKTGKFVYINE